MVQAEKVLTKVSGLKEIADYIINKNFDQALKMCEIYQNEKNKYIILNFKGVIYLSQNNFENAETNFLDSLKENDNFIDPLNNLIQLYLRKKDYEKLLFYSKKLIEIDNSNPSFNYKLGYALEQNNKLDESIEFYKKCINFNGKDKLKALNNIGSILSKSKKNIANQYFLDALKIDQNNTTVINNLLSNYLELRDEKNSDIFYEKAKKIDQNIIHFLYNKADYLILKNQFDSAIEFLKNNKNKDLKLFIKLIRVYFLIGEKDKAQNLLNEFKKIKSNDPEYFQFLGIRLLFQGDFEIGWKYYAYININKKFQHISEDIKEWKGENINQKSILVYYEQGLGDSIQFSKFIIPLLKLTKNVTFLVQKNIIDIFKKDIPNLKVVSNENFHDNKFDFKISLGSLLKFFYKEKIDENFLINNSPFDLPFILNKDKLNVGIAWSGSFNGPNEPYRSIPLKALNKIFSLNVNFYCLQKEIWERDLIQFEKTNITNLSDYSLGDMVAIIQKLDLVISSDTSILHLAASLNKETWGLLNLYPDWRWGAFNKIHPYKSLKLFQQKAFNKWEDVELEIYKNLERKINDK
jgi:tetratricopeptide (TPR) repeat protein